MYIRFFAGETPALQLSVRAPDLPFLSVVAAGINILQKSTKRKNLKNVKHLVILGVPVVEAFGAEKKSYPRSREPVRIL